MGWGDIAIGDLTAGALVAIIVLLILRGLLVPRRTLQDIQEERDTWRKAYEISERSRHELAEQTSRLLQLTETNAKILMSLQEAAHRGDD